jgi:hypothetical protein
VRALQGTVDRDWGGVERFGRLARREAEHVAEDEDRALSGGQVLEGGDERELDGLALLVAGGGRRQVREDHVGERLDPNRLDERLGNRSVWVGRRAVVDWKDSLRSAPDRPQAGIGGDGVQPGAKRAALLEARQPTPRSEERILQRVLGVGR